MAARRQQGRPAAARLAPRAVRGLPFFQGFSVPELQEVFRAGELREYRDGEAIRREGGSRKEIVILLRGQAKVTQQITEGETKILALIAPGQVTGFVSLFLKEGSSATVLSVRPSIVLAISLKNLEALTVRQPALGIKIFRRLLQAAGDRIRILNDQLRTIGQLYVKYRPGSLECPVFKTCLLITARPSLK